MVGIHVERRENTSIINFMIKLKQNEEVPCFYRIKNKKFILQKVIIIKNLILVEK